MMVGDYWRWNDARDNLQCYGCSDGDTVEIGEQIESCGKSEITSEMDIKFDLLTLVFIRPIKSITETFNQFLCPTHHEFNSPRSIPWSQTTEQIPFSATGKFKMGQMFLAE
jgi:hypothetical protein